MTHNCSQLPKKASGTFKPRKPTPKRQMKSAGALTDKDKSKADDYQKKVTT